jgi:SAM-dependent methyltransferase
MTFAPLDDDTVAGINRLQAEYFSEVKQVFDPPYPDGVPERLERIVESANIGDGETVVDIGSGTGVLIPLIRRFKPLAIIANDLSDAMLAVIRQRYPEVQTVPGSIRTVTLPDVSVDVFLINACYPNLVDKDRCFRNIARMLRPGGRVIISHPMGRAFTEFLKTHMPFPVDEFPVSEGEARQWFDPYGFDVGSWLDEEKLFLLRLEKRAG